MKILYITHFDVSDINSCSGTIYHIKNMLENLNHEIIIIDNLKLSKIYKCLIKSISKIFGKKTLIEREPYILKCFARELEKRTKNLEYDLIFAPTSLYFTFFKSKKPMVFYTDATFGGMLDYYINSNDYTKRAIKNGFNQENLALKNADLAIYTSNWAKNTAIKFHNINPDKCVVINRGANIKHSYSENEIFHFINKKNLANGTNKCEFMFLGKDWVRKGGVLACEVVRIMNEKYKVKSTLNIIGSTPKIEEKYQKYVNIVGFLNKNIKSDYEKLESLFKKSDFFLLPTRQEAQGISYAEACSWGMPVIGTNTGGVSGIVKNNINGLLFESSDSAEKYVAEIMKYVKNPNNYIKLSQNAYKYFEEYLTWNVVGKRINKELERIIKKNNK